jgi:fructosamine-3-kinase
MSLWRDIEQRLSDRLGQPFRISERAPLAGGSINNAFRIGDGSRSFFVKTNRAQRLSMFEAEAAGLQALHDARVITVPEPLVHGVSGHESYLVLSWLDMAGQPDSRRFGEAMASLHRCTAKRYGFSIDNTIGSTPQLNQWSDDWIDFWRKQRLGYQLDLALGNGFGHRLNDLGQRLIEVLPAFFGDYRPEPSLLHGDLWSGNWGGLGGGEPVIFDPASYHGDREADLAMMELFGSPGRGFFAAYDAAWPIDPGYATRKTLYNLYHILNHANLFGAGYARQAENMIESLLAEARG